MINDFIAFGLQPELAQAVAELGYTEPMPIQAEIIPVMLAGRDVIGQAQTGTGKTAAFALPMLNNLQPGLPGVQGLVLAPTRELALQVAGAISDMGQHLRVRVLAVYGGAPYGPQIGQLRRGVDIVVGTPGRMMDLMEKKVLDLGTVRCVVLDEADEMLSMGFIEDIDTILAATPQIRQTALFSATLPTEIRRLAEKFMSDPHSVTIQREQVTVEAIEQRYYVMHEADKTAALTRLFEVEQITSALIFVRTKIATGDLANELTARGFPAEALNGDLAQESRERTLNRFRQGKLTVLVATDVAARGLDIDDISHVFNYDLPDDPELYVHRIGRTGRAGKTGIAISLLTPWEKRHLRQIEAFTRKKLQQFTVPTEEAIRIRRQEALAGQVAVWLRRGRCLAERAMAESLVEQGYDPLEIAAAALKIARAEEKQRPIAPMSEVIEFKPERSERSERTERRPWSPRPERSERSERLPRQGSFERNERPDRTDRRSGRPERNEAWAVVSHEPGMVRLSLSLGRQHGVRPNDIVGGIAASANIPGHTIGKILIQDQRSLVDVPAELVGQVLNGKRAMHILRQPVEMRIAE